MNESLPGIIFACTVRGTLLIAIAVVAGPWARRLFGRNGAHWLWLAVLPALLWPLPPRTPLSLRALWPAKPSSVPVLSAPEDASPAGVDAEPLRIKVRNLDSATPMVAPRFMLDRSSGLESNSTASPRLAGWGLWLVSLWLLGVVVALSHLCWRWRSTLRLLREARPMTDTRALAILERFVKPGRVCLAVTSSVRAPALAGLWRPRVLIPEGWLQELSDAELESVLLHELGHHLRRDLLWEWLYAIARCIHWMNPTVWWAERMARQERELACDAWALERIGSPEQYGGALLEALKRMQRGPAASFGIAAMAADACQIARRLEWIGRDRSSPRWLGPVAWVPALLALVAVGTDPVAAQAAGPAIAAASAPAAPSGPIDVASVGKVALVDEPLPLAKRAVEMRMRILRVPETMARELGWPIAAEESKGVEQIISRSEYRRIFARLSAAPEVEVIPGPRQSLLSGQEGIFQAVREFRYGDGYKAASGGVLVPISIKTANLGLSCALQARIEGERTAHLNFDGVLVRLIGFEDENETLTKMPPTPPGMDWAHRLVAYEMPVGTVGSPKFSWQQAQVHLALNVEQVAILFGYRDVDRVPAPGAPREQTMVNYFAVQIDIAP